MAQSKAPVFFLDLAFVMKHMDPNMDLSEAQIWVSELIKCMLDFSLMPKRTSLGYFTENALSHGLQVIGTASDKINAAVKYEIRNFPSQAPRYFKSICTSPQRIVNELLEAINGNIHNWKDAILMEDCEISVFSPDVLLLAAQTFMFRNKHYDVSDEEALHVFHKAIHYLKWEQRTSTEIIKCDNSNLSDIIQSVNRHFAVESIDIIGYRIATSLMESINQGTEPLKSHISKASWDLHLLSKVDCLVDTFKDRKNIFRHRNEDYIFSVWKCMEETCYPWYIFQAGRMWKKFYAMQLKMIVIWDHIYEFKGDFKASDDLAHLKKFEDFKINGDCSGDFSRTERALQDLAVLKGFQDGKIHGNCPPDFMGTYAYSWSREGKPPAHPYAIVAQLYWPHLYSKLNYLQVQSNCEVTDKEALTVLYDEIPRLKRKTYPTFKTYTWFLNKPSDAKLNIPELRDYTVGQTFSEDYLSPSTEPLQTEGFRYEWSRDEHENTHQDFTLIYRARPTLERVPPLITEENWIRFDYWQYIKEFVFFGGSHLEGAVLAPDPAWIDAAHVNGVAIFGTVFLPPLTNGGDVRDLEELAKPESLQKLIDIAHQLNFEGWFLIILSFKDCDEPSLSELKSSLENLDLRGKKLIWYLPGSYESDRFDPKSEGVRMTCNNKINTTAPAFLMEKGKRLYLSFDKLFSNVFFGQAPRNYIMFVDEPSRLTAQEEHKSEIKYRFVYARNCHWQFFLGENGLERKPTHPNPWYGIAKYAMERKRANIKNRSAQDGISDI